MKAIHRSVKAVARSETSHSRQLLAQKPVVRGSCWFRNQSFEAAAGSETSHSRQMFVRKPVILSSCLFENQSFWAVSYSQTSHSRQLLVRKTVIQGHCWLENQSIKAVVQWFQLLIKRTSWYCLPQETNIVAYIHYLENSVAFHN